MTKKDLLKIFKSKKIQFFEVENILDEDCDIILSSDDYDCFFDFCAMTNSKVAFYNTMYIDEKDYLVDEDAIRESIDEIIYDKISRCYFNDEDELNIEDFEAEISQIMKQIKKHNESVVRALSTLNDDELFSTDLFAIYNGVQVGIKVFNETIMNQYLTNTQIEKELEKTVMEVIEKKLSKYEFGEHLHSRSYVNFEKERKEFEAKQKEALEEAEKFLEQDETIIELTNQKLRHAYAKKIAKEYGERYGAYITISDVEVIIDKLYKDLKANSK